MRSRRLSTRRGKTATRRRSRRARPRGGARARAQIQEPDRVGRRFCSDWSVEIRVLSRAVGKRRVARGFVMLGSDFLRLALVGCFRPPPPCQARRRRAPIRALGTVKRQHFRGSLSPSDPRIPGT